MCAAGEGVNQTRDVRQADVAVSPTRWGGAGTSRPRCKAQSCVRSRHQQNEMRGILNCHASLVRQVDRDAKHGLARQV
jgi:hypothetical protein